MTRVPMLDLKSEYDYMKQEIDSAIRRCLEHQKWIFGPEIKEFEDAVAGYLGVKHCIGVSSGTDALVLSLRALAIQRKGKEYFDRRDEILTTSFTFTATGDAILRAGATPVFVDIDPETYNLDANKARDYITSSPDSRVVGIIPVHLYGQSCNMDELTGIAREFSLFLVEDVAQAFGGTWKNKKLGSLGDTGAFSFFPSKNLGGFGDAGMIATKDDGIAELLRMLLKHGGKDKYNVDHIGYNSRLDTLQAAILLAKFKFIDEFNDRRKQLAEVYTTELSSVEELILPGTSQSSHPADTSLASARHVFHQYTVRTPRRDALQEYLTKKGIGTMVYYPFPLHKMKVFSGRMKAGGDLFNAELAAGEVLSLPIEPLQDQDVSRYCIDSIKNFFTGTQSI